MLERLFTRKLLSPADLKPSQDGLEVIGVFNPGVVRFNGTTRIIARVVERPTATRNGCFPSPRMDNGRVVVDWLGCEETDADSDPRTFTSRVDGSLRLRFISHLCLFQSKDGVSIDSTAEPRRLMPEGEYEAYGIEDPRITIIHGTAYITYVAVSAHGVCTAMFSTTDFKSFQREGIIFCPDNKDVVLFPERIMGDYVAMHRPMPAMKFTPPRLWLARSPDLRHWGSHGELTIPAKSSEPHADQGHHRDRIGGGTPPIRTPDGWLTLYHGSDKKPHESGAGRYTAGALLLDPDNPAKVIARSREPIMVPTEPFEMTGFVNNVVFPTAVVEDRDRYLVYGGAADEHLTVVAYDKAQLLATLV